MASENILLQWRDDLNPGLDWIPQLDIKMVHISLSHEVIPLPRPTSLKAAVISIFMLSVDQITMCNAKHVSCSDKPTNKHHTSLQFLSILDVAWRPKTWQIQMATNCSVSARYVNRKLSVNKVAKTNLKVNMKNKLN